MSYVTAEEFAEYLAGSGIVLPEETETWFCFLDSEQKIEAAEDDFEGDTGRTLLAVADVKKFDFPCGRNAILYLGDDLAEITSVTVNGKALIADQDYYVVRRTDTPKSICALEFLTFAPGMYARKNVSVSGYWGMSHAVLPTAKQAILARACVIAYPQLSLAISRGIVKYSKDTTEVDFSKNDQHSPLSVEKRAWEKYYAQAVSSYQDVLIGL